MKLGLIKKSLICVLSISFCALLASCKNGSEQSVSKKNVFAQKDILAYAKKNSMKEKESEYVSPEVVDIDYSKYSVISRISYATLLRDNASDASKLYTKKANKIMDISDSSNIATNINQVYISGEKLDYEIYSIRVTSGYTLVDSYGNIIIKEQAYNNLNIERIVDADALIDGENKFYEKVSYYIGTDSYIDLYRVEATFKNGKIVSAPARTKIESSADIDYSAINYEGNEQKISLKEYDVVIGDSAFYVSDLSGKMVSSFSATNFSSGLILDDKLLFQTTTPVTRNDNYTYSLSGSYYFLQTYSVDLKTGVKKEVKDYKYLIDDEVDFIFGYNEKKDREYVAAEYATLYEIVDKRLSTSPIKGMVDKDGKMISTKVGEKGYSLEYLDDNAYVLNDYGSTSILDSKGKVKASFVNNDLFRIDYKNKFIFINKNGSSGVLLDSNLKVIDYPGRENIICYGVFDNGNAIVAMNGDNALVKFNGSKMEIIKTYDGVMSAISKGSYGAGVGYQCVSINDILVSRNLYLVQTKVDDDTWDLEIVNADGETIKEYKDIDILRAVTDGGFFMQVITETDTHYVGSTIYE